MPQVPGWPDDEFDRRSLGLAALIRRIWRAIARQVVATVESQQTVSLSATRPIIPEWRDALNGQIIGYIENVYLDAAGHVANTLELPDDQLIGDDLVELHVTEARNRLVGIGDDVWQLVQQQITLGNQAGESISEIAARIRNVTGVSTARSLTIARTEVHAAAEAGSYAQALFVDPNAEKVWLATNDDRTRESHRRADGQTVKINEPFNVGATKLRFPGDPLGEPGETISCRCSTAYNFDMITDMDEEISDDAVMVAAGQAWKPHFHPRGNDGKFIEKGALSDFLKKSNPTIIDVSKAVHEMTPDQWNKLTNTQKQYIKDSVNKLPSGSETHKNLKKSIDKIDIGTPAKTASNTNTTPKSSKLTHPSTKITETVDKNGKTLDPESNAFVALNAPGLDSYTFWEAASEISKAEWEKLTNDQQNKLITKVHDLASVADPESKDAIDQIQWLSAQYMSPEIKSTKSDVPSHVTTITPAVTVPKADAAKVTTPTTTKIPAGLKGNPGDPAKVTTGVIWGKHQPGDVVLDTPNGLEQIVWNGKKYDNVVMGKIVESWTKKDAYAQLKNDTHWVIPGGNAQVTSQATSESSQSSPTPTTTSPWAGYSSDELKKLYDKGLMTTDEFLEATGTSPNATSEPPQTSPTFDPYANMKPGDITVDDAFAALDQYAPGDLVGKYTYKKNGITKSEYEFRKSKDGTGIVVYEKPAGMPTFVAQKKYTSAEDMKKPGGFDFFKKVDPPKAMKPTPSTDVPSLSTLHDFSGFKKIGGQAGSNPGGKYEASDGTKWYIKAPKSAQHASNEVAAAALYNLAGINTPQVVKGSGASGLIVGPLHTGAKIVPGAQANLSSKLSDKDYIKEIQAGFAIDAWLANWDVAGTGYDNIVEGADGKPYRIDVGGAMLYRAQGSPKGAQFSDDVVELDTMRNPAKNHTAAKIFGSMTDDDIRASVKRLEAISDADIDKIVSDAGLPQHVAHKLKLRRQDILKKYPPIDAMTVAPSTESTTITSNVAKPSPVKPMAMVSGQSLSLKQAHDLIVNGKDKHLDSELIAISDDDTQQIVWSEVDKSYMLVNTLFGGSELISVMNAIKKIRGTSPTFSIPVALIPGGKGDHENNVADAYDGPVIPDDFLTSNNVDVTPGGTSSKSMLLSDAESGMISPDEAIVLVHQLTYDEFVHNLSTKQMHIIGVKINAAKDKLLVDAVDADAKWKKFKAEWQWNKGLLTKDEYHDLLSDIETQKANFIDATKTAVNTTNHGAIDHVKTTGMPIYSINGEWKLEKTVDDIHGWPYILTKIGGLGEGTNWYVDNVNEVEGTAGLQIWNPQAPTIGVPKPAGPKAGKKMSLESMFVDINHDEYGSGETVAITKDGNYRLVYNEVLNSLTYQKKTGSGDFRDDESWYTIDMFTEFGDDDFDSIDQFESNHPGIEWFEPVYSTPDPDTKIPTQIAAPKTNEALAALQAKLDAAPGLFIPSAMTPADAAYVPSPLTTGDKNFYLDELDEGSITTGELIHLLTGEHGLNTADLHSLTEDEVFTAVNTLNNAVAINAPGAKQAHAKWLKLIDPGAAENNVVDSSTVVPTTTPPAPVTPTLSAPSVSTSTPTPTVHVPLHHKNTMKAQLKTDGAGYWSKPEKIWTSIKNIQAKPGFEKYSPLDIIKALDSGLKTQKPNPFEEKMVKWASSAKGAGIVNKAGGLSTTPTESVKPINIDLTPENVAFIWDHVQKLPVDTVIATGNKNGFSYKLVVAKNSFGTSLNLMQQDSTTGELQKMSSLGKFSLENHLKSEKFAPIPFNWKPTSAIKTGAPDVPLSTATVPSAPSAPSVPSTPPTSPNVTTISKTLAGNVDISHIPDDKQQAVYASFKGNYGAYLSSPAGSTYDGLESASKSHGISLAETIAIVDEIGAKKVNKPNANLFYDKISKWLATPEAVAHLLDEPVSHTNLPTPPAFLPHINPDITLPTLEDSNKFVYTHVPDVHAAGKIWNDIVAKSEPITPQQEQALKTWTGGTYSTINSYLYAPNKTLSPTHKTTMNNAQKGMRPSDRPMLLMRGVGYSGVGNAKNHAQLLKMIGQTWHNNAFAATSVGTEPAFASHPVWIEVEAPPGTPMAWLDPFSLHKGEREMLLAAGLHYHIVSIEQKSVPGYGLKSVVRARIVPKPANTETELEAGA